MSTPPVARCPTFPSSTRTRPPGAAWRRRGRRGPRPARAPETGTGQAGPESNSIDRQGGNMADLAHDIRYGLRMLGKDPGQTAAAAVALGLGIGLTVLVFSIVY